MREGWKEGERDVFKKKHKFLQRHNFECFRLRCWWRVEAVVGRHEDGPPDREEYQAG